MNIQFKPNEYLMQELQQAFVNYGVREAMFLDHYELEELTNYSAEQWKEFLKHPLVADFLQEEMVMFRDKQIRSILRDVKDAERSVGVAQVINSLSKLDLTQMGNNNKLFIYTYVPLDEQEQQSENVRTAPSDVFSL